MNLRTLFCCVALLPCSAFADKGGFTFNIADSQTVFPPSCVKSVEFQPRDEIESENLFIAFTDTCRDRLTQLSRQNIGKTANISYKGNVFASPLIVSVLGSQFRISAKEMPRVILMQILNDYAVTTH